MKNAEVQILEKYVPPVPKAYVVANHLLKLTKNLGLIPFDEPRAKHHRKSAWFDEKLHAECRLTASSKEDEDWHRDLDQGDLRQDCGLVLWCDWMPTQVRYEDGYIFQAEPYDVVLINNLAVMHRRPPNVPLQRMSFRQRVEWPFETTSS